MENCYYCKKACVNNVVLVQTGLDTNKTALCYCSDTCKDKLLMYGEYTKKYAKILTYLNRGLIIVLLLLVLIREIIQHDNIFLLYSMSITLLVTGVIGLFFPFAKLSECSFLGVRRSKIFSRVIAILLFLWAARIIYYLIYLSLY